MVNPENDDDLCRELVSQIETVFDLDKPEIELVKTDLSKYGVTNYPKCHVHDILILSLSFILPKNDMIPARCSANKGDDGTLSLFFGEDQAEEQTLPQQYSLFFRDDCHGWTQLDVGSEGLPGWVALVSGALLLIFTVKPLRRYLGVVQV